MRIIQPAQKACVLTRSTYNLIERFLSGGLIIFMLYNVYCDETCHLEHDGINDMVIGAVWCPQNKLREINQRIKEIKARNGISPSTELKWTKVSPAKVQAYKDVIDYFFDDDDLHFRAIIIPDKSKLNHAA